MNSEHFEYAKISQQMFMPKSKTNKPSRAFDVKLRQPLAPMRLSIRFHTLGAPGVESGPGASNAGALGWHNPSGDRAS